MKMVKSLLLGSAAGLIAVAGAQAADLPVKAKAVEYVKICSLYGVGYYYIPGTDTCIKIGGYVRFEAYHNASQGAYPTSFVPTPNTISTTAVVPPVGDPFGSGGAFTGVTSTIPGAMTRHYNPFAMQARFRLTGDVRTQTEYGTLRAYFAFGLNALNLQNEVSGPGLTASMERAFIQFAGFTIGRADTFFAFYNGAAYGLVPTAMDGSSGPAGLNVAAYTWQFGNGLSASLSLEDGAAHTSYVIDMNARGLMGDGDSAGQKVPDIVGNLRVDQAWGSAQIMGALHQVSGRYHHNFSDPAGTCYGGAAGNPLGTGNNSTTACTHPDDKWGWAVGAGLTLKMPWDAKDTLSGVIAYSEGASRYVAFGQQHNFLHKQGMAMGAFTDGVFMNPNTIAGYDGSIQLTEAWGGTVAFEHYWTPSLRTSFVAGYLNVSYNDTVKNLMASNPTTCRAGFNGGIAMTNVSNCNPDWSAWRLSSRTMWNPVANLDVGVEVAYSKINTAFAGTAVVNAGNGLAVGQYNIEDQDIWTATFRIQRSFWP